MSITLATSKRHIVNDLICDKFACVVRFRTPLCKFGHYNAALAVMAALIARYPFAVAAARSLL